MALAVFGLVTLPLKFPFEAQRELVDSGVIVGLVLPLVVMSRILDEGPHQLVVGASRALARARLCWVGGYAGAVAVGSATAWWIAPVPFSLFAADALFLAAVTVLGVGTLGSRLGWILPLASALVASAPGLVPWQANLLYRQGHAAILLLIAAIVATAGSAGYARFGSLGVIKGNTVRRADAALTD